MNNDDVTLAIFCAMVPYWERAGLHNRRWQVEQSIQIAAEYLKIREDLRYKAKP